MPRPDSSRYLDPSIWSGLRSQAQPPRPFPSPVKRRFRFRLRTLLLGMVVLCVGMGGITNYLARVRRQRAAVAALVGIGAEVSYQRTPVESAFAKSVSRAFGTDFVRSPTDVVLIGKRVETTQLEPIQRLTGLRNVDLYRTPVSDEAIHYLQNLTLIESLDLRKTSIGDEGVRGLESLKGLNVLLLDGPEITGATLGHLRGAPLQILDLSDSAITDETLEPVAEFRLLGELYLEGTQISDRTLRRLSRLPKLRQLWLRRTNVTRQGVEEFRTQLPGCWLKTDFDQPDYRMRPEARRSSARILLTLHICPDARRWRVPGS